MSPDDVRTALADTRISVEWTPEMQQREQETENLYRELGSAFARSSWDYTMSLTEDDRESTVSVPESESRM